MKILLFSTFSFVAYYHPNEPFCLVGRSVNIDLFIISEFGLLNFFPAFCFLFSLFSLPRSVLGLSVCLSSLQFVYRCVCVRSVLSIFFNNNKTESRREFCLFLSRSAVVVSQLDTVLLLILSSSSSSSLLLLIRRKHWAKLGTVQSPRKAREVT